jgi:hypothetical protein
MRAPSPSFKSELTAIREDYVASNQGRHELPLAISIIDRWIKRNETDAIWETLKSKIPDALPREFIIGLLNHRLTLENVNRIIRDGPGVEAKIKTRTKRHLQAKKHLELAYENAMLGHHIEIREQLLGRKKTTAARQMFMAGCSSLFKHRCGQPLDEVVRVLTEIAFDCNVTLDMVREATKPPRQRGIRHPK